MTKAFTFPNSNHGPIVIVRGTWSVYIRTRPALQQPSLSCQGKLKHGHSKTALPPNHTRGKTSEKRKGQGDQEEEERIAWLHKT